MSFSSPTFMPTICSSKPGTKEWEPRLKVVALRLAAVEALAVEVAVKVDVRDVAHLSLAVNADLAGVLLAGVLDLVRDVFLGDLEELAHGLNALVLAESDLGVCFNGEGIGNAALVSDLNVNDRGRADELDLVLVYALLKGLGGKVVHRVLIEHVDAIHALDHCAGSLALAEAGNSYIALIFEVCGVDGGLELRRVALYLKNDVIFFLFYVLDDHGLNSSNLCVHTLNYDSRYCL